MKAQPYSIGEIDTKGKPVTYNESAASKIKLADRSAKAQAAKAPNQPKKRGY